MRHEISQCNDLLFYNDRLIVPVAKRKQVLDRLHECHFSLTKLTQKAKLLLYWPGMVDSIRTVVERCTACNEYASKPKREPLMPAKVPEYPFQVVGTDLFHADGKDYLLTVDYYSKWLTVDELKGTQTAQVVDKLEGICCDFGLMETLKSDNGPQYTSVEFKKFLMQYGIRHETSSPGYARSNGLAERMVQTVKNLIRKCNLEQKIGRAHV